MLGWKETKIVGTFSGADSGAHLEGLDLPATFTKSTKNKLW